jgi:hypothetical protein
VVVAVAAVLLRCYVVVGSYGSLCVMIRMEIQIERD